MASVVEQMRAEHDALIDFLLANEPSLAVSTSVTLTKSLLLAGASELEVEIARIIVDFYNDATGKNQTAVQFVEREALARQYHTLFQWDGNSANQFFSLFGPDLKAHASRRIEMDEVLGAAIRDFLALGSLRNQLVHGNFAAFSLSQTVDEVFALYQSACAFRDALPGLLRQI